MAEKLDMKSKDWLNENTQFIVERFPNCVTETEDGLKVDFELLQQELSSDVVSDSKERYRLEWPGKRQAMVNANLPTTKILRPVREDSVDFDNTENLYIEGDNLEVLKILQESYLGKIKMIYIDPPYNTGKDFVYKDNFTQDSEEYKEESGQTDEYNRRLVSNPDTSGRYHSDWLSMMYPRLKLARNLLTEDGVICISIDDSEIDNLKKLCAEIFGSNNHIATMIWEQGKKSLATTIAVNHEYCVIYSRDSSQAKNSKDSTFKKWRRRKTGLDSIYHEFHRLRAINKSDFESISTGLRSFYNSPKTETDVKAHKHYNKVDEKGIYFAADISQGTGNGGRFNIVHPITNKPCKVPSGGWRFAHSKLAELLSEGRIHFGEDETTVPCFKRYLTETEYEVPGSVFYKDGRGATKRLSQLLGSKVFDFPKDEEVLAEIIELIVNPQSSDVVLDFFSGSASTAHAVMALNSRKEGNIRHIQVQLPESCEEGRKIGFYNICEIGKERIRKAGHKFISEGTPLKDPGFKVYRVDESNMEDVYYQPQTLAQGNMDMFASNIKADRTSEDLLTQVLLDWGLPLTLKTEKASVEGKEVFKVAGDSLYACFDEGLDEAFAKAMAAEKPLRLVVKDSAFASDTAKVNVQQLLKQLSPYTELRVI